MSAFHRAKNTSVFISTDSINLFRVTGNFKLIFCWAPLYLKHQSRKWGKIQEQLVLDIFIIMISGTSFIIIIIIYCNPIRPEICGWRENELKWLWLDCIVAMMTEVLYWLKSSICPQNVQMISSGILYMSWLPLSPSPWDLWKKVWWCQNWCLVLLTN